MVSNSSIATLLHVLDVFSSGQVITPMRRQVADIAKVWKVLAAISGELESGLVKSSVDQVGELQVVAICALDLCGEIFCFEGLNNRDF